MTDHEIDNPILNSPYLAPTRHFRFDEQGLTSEVVARRRASEYFIPVPSPRRRIGQLELPNEWTSERLKTNDQVNQIRAKLDIWRRQGRPGVTGPTRALLGHWLDDSRFRRLFFCQVEAAETVIWLTEVAPKGDPWLANQLREHNGEFNSGLPRVALKMATGSGKTLLMAMLIAWHTLNKAANAQAKAYTDAFLVVTPGLTIRDRLRVLLPSDPDNYYRALDLVPPDLHAGLSRARVVITTFHAFALRETRDGGGAGRLTKQVLAAGEASPFIETPDQMVRRVCRDLEGKKGLVVLNDEAHHCWQAPSVPTAPTVERLAGDEKREASDRAKAAHLWIGGLKAVQAKIGIRRVYDLSATPFFLKGSGYGEGTLFPWVVSDFSLIDAIECGIVKIPRLPVADNAAVADLPVFRDLWSQVRDGLPKKGRKALAGGVEPDLPPQLQGALSALYDHYDQSYQHWQETDIQTGGSTPPVFIVVCQNTAISKLVYDHVAGWEKNLPTGGTTVVPGALGLFRNDDGYGNWLPRPRTILVDSEQLESGEAMTPEFRTIAAAEIAEFKNEVRQRFPGRDVDQLTEEDLLREVMNTVGKPGRLGEHVRCVVSVSMLTEGWDANTVTHILGVRAFGTQLLCEQVVGRGLRRRSYVADETTGHLLPEYAEVYGVPFSFIRATGRTRDPRPTRPVVHVRALPDREQLAIEFPRVVGYRFEIPDERLDARFNERSQMTLTTADVPTRTEVRGVVGEREIHTLASLAAERDQSVAYELARGTLTKFRDAAGNDRPWLFPQLLRIARRWLDTCVTVKGDAFNGLLLLADLKHNAADLIYQAVCVASGRDRRLLPILRAYDPVGSTRGVAFDTVRPVYETREDRCHISHVALDSTWEQQVADAIETTSHVLAYAKNDHLGFTIPYTIDGEPHSYAPDFLLRFTGVEGAACTLIVEVSGEKRRAKDAKTAAAQNQWVEAVNNHGGHGRWAFVEITDPYDAAGQLKTSVAALRAAR